MNRSVSMGRRAFLASAAGVCFAAARRPNIVLIVADDLGYGETGAQGNREIPTPNIDSIAKAGVRFTDAYSSAPYCSPSRAGLMTGRYQNRFGHELNPVGRANLLAAAGLPLREKTLASYLQRAGYRTALAGKWHLGAIDRFHPQERGFDEFFGFLHEGHFYVPPAEKRIVSHLRPKEPPYDDNNPILRGRNPVSEPQYLTDAFAREACAFIDRDKNQPFFLYAPFNSVHSPMQADPPDVDRFAYIADPHRRVFAAMLWSLDRAVGRILTTLRKNRIESNTLVVFLSDNGGPVQELTSSNAPLRGQKGQLYEGGIRVPFLLQWPARIAGRRTLAEPVISLDLLPTMLDAAGITNVDGEKLDGESLLPLLARKRRPEPARPLYWRYDRSAALRLGQWKIVRQMRRGDAEAAWQLYDLKDDIAEARDLATAHPERVQDMVARWEARNAEMAPPTPLV